MRTRNCSTATVGTSHDDTLPTQELSVVPLDTLTLQHAADDLYHSVFGYVDRAYALSPRLLRGLLLNGGSALGALDSSGKLLGFSYGYTGIDAGGIYHYSQATAVADSAQGLGIGRLLKYAQADVARTTGAKSMRWAFDPAIARNGHFNLDILGARGLWFYPGFYDEAESDRMMVDWAIAGAAAGAVRSDHESILREIEAEIPANSLTASGTLGNYRWLSVPSELPHAAETRLAVRGSVAAGCSEAIAAGLVALSCHRSSTAPHAAVYLFGEDGA